MMFALFRAVCENNQPVGYVMVFPFNRDGVDIVNIVRLMVAAAHQGRGRCHRHHRCRRE